MHIEGPSITFHLSPVFAELWGLQMWPARLKLGERAEVGRGKTLKLLLKLCLTPQLECQKDSMKHLTQAVMLDWIGLELWGCRERDRERESERERERNKQRERERERERELAPCLPTLSSMIWLDFYGLTSIQLIHKIAAPFKCHTFMGQS